MPNFSAIAGGRVLNAAQPINWSHPLNVGLVSEWAVAPPIVGGSTWLDLCRRNNGTMLGNPTWGGNKIGLVAASSQTVRIADASSLQVGAAFSVFGWVVPTAVATTSTLIRKNGATGSVYTLALVSSKLFVEVRTSNVNNGTLSNGSTYWVGATYNGATLTSYINGLSQGTASTASQAENGGLLYFGSQTASNQFYSGSVWGITIANACYTGSQVYSMYQEQRLGNPNRWNWLSSRTYFGVQATTAIAFDAASNSGYQTASSSYSWSHTCTGSNRFLAVDVSLLSVPGTTVSAITYNGVNLEPIGSQSTVSGAGRVECWGLANPASGSNTIAVTLSAAVGSAGTAASYTGVNQTSPYEAFNSAQATNVGAATATVSVTTIAANDWVHGAIATDDGSVTAGQTSRNNVTGALGSGANEDTGPQVSPGAVTISYTGVGALATWAIAGYGIRLVSDAAITVLTRRNNNFRVGNRSIV